MKRLFLLLLAVLGIHSPVLADPEKLMLKFQVYDGDLKKPGEMSFELNATDRRKSEFLKIGEKFPDTNWQLTKFESKRRKNAKTGEEEDVSELTLTNLITSEKRVLVLGAKPEASAVDPGK